MSKTLKVIVTEAQTKGFYVIAKSGDNIVHAEYHNARTTAQKIASAMRKGIELGIIQSAIANSEPVKTDVSRDIVAEFLEHFWDINWYMGVEESLCTFRCISIGVKKQAATWKGLLELLVDKNDALEMEWCKQKGITF